MDYPPPQRPAPLDAIPEDIRQRVRDLGWWRRVKMIESEGNAISDEEAFRRGLDGEGQVAFWMFCLLAFMEMLQGLIYTPDRNQAFYRKHTLSVDKYISIETHENGYLPPSRHLETWREAFARAWRFTAVFTPTSAREQALHELEIAWVQAYERSRAQHEKNYNALSAEVRSVLERCR